MSTFPTPSDRWPDQNVFIMRHNRIESTPTAIAEIASDIEKRVTLLLHDASDATQRKRAILSVPESEGDIRIWLQVLEEYLAQLTVGEKKNMWYYKQTQT